MRDTLIRNARDRPGPMTPETDLPAGAGGTPLPGMPPFAMTGHADLVGRTAESFALSSFLELALTRGDGLLVTGEAGVGKTALLEAALRHPAASSATVLRAAGVEFEAEVGFAGLNQLLLPLIDDLEELAPPHRDALCVALGL